MGQMTVVGATGWRRCCCMLQLHASFLAVDNWESGAATNATPWNPCIYYVLTGFSTLHACRNELRTVENDGWQPYARRDPGMRPRQHDSPGQHTSCLLGFFVCLQSSLLSSRKKSTKRNQNIVGSCVPQHKVFAQLFSTKGLDKLCDCSEPFLPSVRTLSSSTEF